MTRRHRTMLLSLPWALIGLAISVAVAWGFAFRSIHDAGTFCARQVRQPEPDSFASDSRLPPGAMGLTRYTGTGVLVLVGEAVAPDYHELPGIRIDIRGTMPGMPEENAPRWAHSDVFPWLHNHAPWPSESNGARSWDQREVDARGWPLPALYCVRALPAQGREQLRGGVVVSNRKRVSTGGPFIVWPHPLTLPLYPVWGGLLADSALYATMSLGLWRLGIWLRKAKRAPPGHCPQCGYNLAGIRGPCPECGA
jgi:hypothetical protein